MRPIIRDGRTYSHQTVYWWQGAFYWHGTNERLTPQEVQHFRRFQQQPPRRDEAAATFMQTYNATPAAQRDGLLQAMWDIEQKQFDREEDGR